MRGDYMVLHRLGMKMERQPVGIGYYRAIRMSPTELSNWTLQEAARFANLVRSERAATSSVVQRTSDILFPHDVIKQIVGAMYNVDADGTEVFRRVRDGQFGIYKNAPNINAD